MRLTEDEHHRYIFEKLQAAIDTETKGFARDQPELNHERIRRHVRTIMAAYLRSQRNASMAREEEDWASLQQFMGETYPGNAPTGEYEAVHNLVRRVKERMGWDQIADTTMPARLQDGVDDS